MNKTIAPWFALCSFVSCLVVITAMMLGKATEISTMSSGAILATFDDHYITNYSSWRGCDGIWTCTENICQMSKQPNISFIGVSPTDVMADANGTDCSLGLSYVLGWMVGFRPSLAGFIVVGLSVAFEVVMLCIYCVTLYTEFNGKFFCGVYGANIFFGILAVLAVALMTAGHGLYYGFIVYWRHLVGDIAPIYVVIGQLVASVCLVLSLIISHVLLVTTYCTELYSISELRIESSSIDN